MTFPQPLTRRHCMALAALSAFTALAPAAVRAEAYPTKLITSLVAFPAGGQGDVTWRVLQPSMQKILGQTMIVENVAGAGGSLGAQKLLNAPADGYTVLAATTIEVVQTPLALATVKYKSEDFRMVAPIASTYMMLVVRPTLEVSSAADLVALAKKRDGQLSFGSVGAGSAYHLVTERFAKDTGVKLLHVPYKGAAQMFTDLAGSQIDLAFMPLGGPVPGMIQTGKFKPLAFTGPSRHPMFPNIPTLNETQVVKDFVFDIWVALMVPKATPEPVAQRLNAAVAEVIRQPQVRKEIDAAGGMPAQPMTLAEVDRFYHSEIARYRAIAKAIDLKPE